MIDPLNPLIEAFSSFPGIGEKTAQRMAYWLVKQPSTYVSQLANTIQGTVANTQTCKTCCAYSSSEECDVCADPKRAMSVICVVATTEDMRSFVKNVPDFIGSFHVLQGVINPLEGKGPENIRMAELLKRVHALVDDYPEIELINALDGSIESEATGLYMKKVFKGIARISRIAFGLSLSTDISSADSTSLQAALQNRQSV